MDGEAALLHGKESLVIRQEEEGSSQDFGESSPWQSVGELVVDTEGAVEEGKDSNNEDDGEAGWRPRTDLTKNQDSEDGLDQRLDGGGTARREVHAQQVQARPPLEVGASCARHNLSCPRVCTRRGIASHSFWLEKVGAMTLREPAALVHAH